VDSRSIKYLVKGEIAEKKTQKRNVEGLSIIGETAWEWNGRSLVPAGGGGGGVMSAHKGGRGNTEQKRYGKKLLSSEGQV